MLDKNGKEIFFCDEGIDSVNNDGNGTIFINFDEDAKDDGYITLTEKEIQFMYLSIIESNKNPSQ